MSNSQKILRATMFFFVGIQDRVVWQLAKWKSTHRLLLLPGIEPYRWTLGRWRAYRTMYLAEKKVPAYRSFTGGKASEKVRQSGLRLDFQHVHPMDKESYIKKYSAEARCWGGKLPTRGVMVDESSGSSGHPTSWVRGKAERSIVRQIIKVGFSELADNQPVFIINCFAMGAWATGMASTMALIDDYIVKSTGPDMKKVTETMQDFGTQYRYVILGYPPFLKELADNEELNIKQYKAMAIFGGEALSESLRDRLLEHFSYVGGSYGASDLEINIATENPFTIALRKHIMANAQLREELIQEERGVLPMIFQYNPFDYVFETNNKSELLVTIGRRNNINPRIRYNIHDIGHVIRLKDLRPLLQKYKIEDIERLRQMDFPVLFYYGRSDLSLDFYGAVVSPESIRQAIYSSNRFSTLVNTFRLIAYEDQSSTKRLQFAVELKEGMPKPSEHDTKELHQLIQDYLLSNNFDYKQAVRVSSEDPKTVLYPYNEGVFTRHENVKLKNEYIWNLSYQQAKDHGIIKTRT